MRISTRAVYECVNHQSLIDHKQEIRINISTHTPQDLTSNSPSQLHGMDQLRTYPPALLLAVHPNNHFLVNQQITMHPFETSMPHNYKAHKFLILPYSMSLPTCIMRSIKCCSSLSMDRLMKTITVGHPQ